MLSGTHCRTTASIAAMASSSPAESPAVIRGAMAPCPMASVTTAALFSASRAGPAQKPATGDGDDDEGDDSGRDELQNRAKGVLPLAPTRTAPRRQTPKLSPQEHVLVAFGFRILNPRRSRVSS